MGVFTVVDDGTMTWDVGIIATATTTACGELMYYTCGGNGVVIFLL